MTLCKRFDSSREMKALTLLVTPVCFFLPDGDGNLGPTLVSIDVDDGWEPPPMLQYQNPSKKTEGT